MEHAKSWSSVFWQWHRLRAELEPLNSQTNVQIIKVFYAVLHYTNITFPIKLERFYLLYGKCQIIKQPYISSTLSLFLLVSLKTGVQKKISNKQLSFEPPYKRLSCVPFNSSHVYIRAQFPLGIHFVNCKHSGLIPSKKYTL